VSTSSRRARSNIASAAVFSGKDERIRLGDGVYVLHSCAVLRDYLGDAVGSVLVLQDITERLEHRREFILGGVMATGLLLAVCFTVLYASFGTLIGRLERSAAETRQAKEELQDSNNELERRVLLRTAQLQEANETLAREANERIELDKALWDSHDRLLRVLDGLDAVVYVADLTTYEVLFANQYARESFGELVGKKCWQTVQSGQSGPCAFCTNRRLVGVDGQPTAGAAWEFENATLGKWYAIRERAIPWVDNRLVRLAIATDITARKNDDVKIRASLHEKELLLKEVHHRVKNNLQIISSMLRLQSTCEGGAELVRDSQSRIRAMSLIHEKLYQSADLSRIDMGEYLRSLVANLTASFGVTRTQVRADVEADQVSLNIDTAVICGLIVNELVTNSLKHAFPPGRGGEVLVGLSRVEDPGRGDTLYQIVVSDNGVGLPANFDFEAAKTLGLQLVAMLASQQLQGDLEVSREGGTRFTLRFRELTYGSRT
jgi:two-component sensor histidine kinase/PAS domain-containing protein